LKDAYHLQTAAFIDMFPQTKHCEVVAGLTLLSHA
jgi:tRNA/tmRNA/rRNA uracil-C5-methylase (TrmA/RlmC/RlmD family)